MAITTSDTGEIPEVTRQISQSTCNRIFELAVMIDQIEVEYHSDPLVMANDAISKMRQYASEIAALSPWDDLT